MVCFDEKSTQLLADKQKPIPMKKGRATRQDYELMLRSAVARNEIKSGQGA